jgi:pyruvate dehydrogenase E2 component (dihydrolipoamide acetyltransferase)
MISAASRRVVNATFSRCQSKLRLDSVHHLQSYFRNDIRAFSSLPYHLVVGMPALSPTMEAGTISAWNVKEGDTFIAGDSLADIETDKASIAFEAQDDGVVAKILVEAGSGEIKVGTPIMVTVEEEEDVAAFANFVPEVVAEAPASPVVESAAAAPPPPKPELEAPSSPPASPAPVTAVADAPITAPAEAVPAPPVSVAVTSDTAPTVGPSWGSFAKVRSPLSAVLSKDQKKYVEMYGSTGQIPL